MTGETIRDVPKASLEKALADAHEETMGHLAKKGVKLSGPCALALYDLSMPDLQIPDFPDTRLVVSCMMERLVAVYGTPGHDRPLKGPRYAVPSGGLNLSVLEITAIKAAEIMVTGRPNLGILTARQKWPGACASFGGRPLFVTTSLDTIWPLAVTTSGYDPRHDLRFSNGGAANVEETLIDLGYVPAGVIESETFILGPAGTWSYPEVSSVAHA